jgi:hypothetical protein
MYLHLLSNEVRTRSEGISVLPSGDDDGDDDEAESGSLLENVVFNIGQSNFAA